MLKVAPKPVPATVLLTVPAAVPAPIIVYPSFFQNHEEFNKTHGHTVAITEQAILSYKYSVHIMILEESQSQVQKKPKYMSTLLVILML